MRLIALALAFLLFSTASNSQNIFLEDSNYTNIPDQLVSKLQFSGNSTEHLIIRWPQLEKVNPFSTSLVHYEIWHNGKYIDTVADNSYLLAIDLAEQQSASGCIRLRAIQGRQKSEMSEPGCYTIASAQ